MATPLEARGHWEHWLVHLLWVASTRTSALGEAALADGPVTLAGLGMLENVNARPGITISEISRRAPQTQQALSQIAARLERLGFIERRLAAPGQGRGVGLHLTPAGEDARLRAEQAIEEFEAALADALGARRHARLLKLLEELRPVFDDLHGARGSRPGGAA
jgi:DNA-binding MarR family transcriptional regulator